MKKSTLLLVLALSGCATTGPQHVQTTDSRACAKNFTVEGSFLAGKTYKTNDIVSDVSQSLAMKKAAQYTAANGWSITNTNNQLGIISAAQTVSYGSGKTAPLSISISENDSSSGVNVAMSFSISGGVVAPLESVREHFCGTIASIGK